jgi:hypothetical protein
MAHAGTASWRSTQRAGVHRGGGQQNPSGSTGRPTARDNRRVAYSRQSGPSGQEAKVAAARTSGKAGASTRSPNPGGRTADRSARSGGRPSEAQTREGSAARPGRTPAPPSTGSSASRPTVAPRPRSSQPPISSKPQASLPAPKQRVLRRPRRPRPKGKS